MIWKMNNRALCAFIFEHLSDNDYGIASTYTSAHDTYVTITPGRTLTQRL
jgi:hypothetical protein